MKDETKKDMKISVLFGILAFFIFSFIILMVIQLSNIYLQLYENSHLKLDQFMLLCTELEAKLKKSYTSPGSMYNKPDIELFKGLPKPGPDLL